MRVRFRFPPAVVRGTYGSVGLWLIVCVCAADNAVVAPSRGNPRAPVTISVYTDLLCAFCRQAEVTLDELLAAYPDGVRIAFHHFPAAEHKQARLAHQAAVAAADWDHFWPMCNEIFAAESTVDQAFLLAAAQRLEIPTTPFVIAMASKRIDDVISADIAAGKALGVEATPTIFIEGRRIDGAQPFAVFDYHVRRALGLPASRPAVPLKLDDELLTTDPEPDHQWAWGPAAGATVVKVFVDLRSPLGRRTVPQLRRVLAMDPPVRLVLKHLPLGIYKDSLLAHELAVALAKRRLDVLALWQQMLTVRSLSIEWADSYVAGLGLPAEALQAVHDELTSGAHRNVISHDLSDAVQLQVNGSPTAFIDGRRYDAVSGLAAGIDELSAR